MRTALSVLVFALAGGCRGCDGDGDGSDGSSAPAENAADPARPSQWTVEGSAAATAIVRYNDSELATFTYACFAPGWKFVRPKVRSGQHRDSFSLAFEQLGVTAQTHVLRGDGELEYTYKLSASTTQPTQGCGLEFKLKKHPTLMERGAKKPTLLDDNRGFHWDTGGGETLVFEFNGPMARVKFERGKPDQLRAYFYEGQIKAGAREVTLKIKLPAGGTVVLSPDERYGELDPQTWRQNTLAWDRWPIDLSFLNEGHRPAGAHGRVKASGDDLVFADGTPARFWGANVVAGTLFSGSKTQVAHHAKRIAAMGFNLARLHHHDSYWVKPNVFDSTRGDTRALDAKTLDRIDWWVKCLEDEGVYVWIDLHVQRQFTAKDGIRSFGELEATKGQGKAFNYVNPDVEKRMRSFGRQYLGRKNAYTGRNYAEDPGVVAVLVTNENDITYHGAKLLVPKGGAMRHVRMFERLATEFAVGAGLPADAALRLRSPGPAKVVLNELEAQFHKRAISDLRGLGYAGLLATTNFWGSDPLWALPALTVGDLVDVHAYGRAEFLSSNPLVDGNFITFIASAQVSGLPLTISEWNVPFPARDRFAAPLYVASIGALQGWDAAVLYAYAQQQIRTPQQRRDWTTWDDAGTHALMPVAALAFRRGDVARAKNTYRLQLSTDDVYGKRSSGDRSAAIRTLAELSRLEIALPDHPALDWDTQPTGLPDATVVTDLDKSFLGAEATSVESDTGELVRDWARGVQTVNTARTQAAAGWIGDETISLRDVEIAVRTPKAALAVSALDEAPIASSKRLLVCAAAQVKTAGKHTLPYYAQPVAGEIAIRSTVEGLVLTPLMDAAPKGAAAQPVPGRRDGDRVRFELPAAAPTHWYLVTPASG